MKSMINCFCISVCLIINFVGANSSGVNPSCKTFTTKGSRDNQTVLRLDFNERQGNESIDVDRKEFIYEWNVYASIIGGKCDSQLQHIPCYLLAWKSALALRNQLRVNGLIQGRNGERQVSISNAMIKFGIQYVIELRIIQIPKLAERTCVSLSNPDKESIDNRQQTNDDKLAVMLIGPDRTFYTVPLIINAYVVGNYTNVTFKWTHKESPGAPLQIIEYQGAWLELPGNTLKNARTYEFFCDVIDDDNNVVTTDSLKVSVRKPKPIIRFQSRNQSVGVNQPIRIIAHLDVPQDINYEIIWTCTFNGNNCGRFSSTNILYISNGFSELGLYKFELFVSQCNVNASIHAVYIEVKEFERSIEFDELPTWINPTKQLDVTFILNNIQSACSVEWQSLHNINEDYQELNISKTNFNKVETVFVYDDPYLKELLPYNKKPSTQTYTLKINPELMQLEQDSKYLLRCLTFCVTDYNQRQTIYADLEFVTNAPPITNNLNVWPRSGRPLSTIFSFETVPAKDKFWDLPLTYSFGWYPTKRENSSIRNDESIVYFARVQELYMAETILPFIEETNGFLGTIMSVCDNKGNCNNMEGPTVKVSESATVFEENHFKLQTKIVHDLASNNFCQFTIDVLLLFWSYKSDKNIGLFGDIQMAVNDLLVGKIKNLMDSPNKVLIQELISSLTSLISKKEINYTPSENLLKNLGKLRGKLIHEKMAEQIVTDGNQEEHDLRISDKNKQDIITLQDIQKYFESAELIIATSDDPNVVAREKQNFIRSFDKYLNEICYILYNNPDKHNFKFSFQTSYTVVEKFNSDYFRNFMYIPSPSNNWNAYMKILLNQSWHMQVTGRPMCIGRAILQNYLRQPELLFYARLFNSDRTEFIMSEQPNTIVSSTGTPHNIKCSVYSNGTWYQCRKRSTNSMCMCNKMGFFRFHDSDDNELEFVGEGGESDGNAFEEKDGNAETIPGKTTEVSGSDIGGPTSAIPESGDSNTVGPMVTTSASGSSSTVGITSKTSFNTNTTLENREIVTEIQRVTDIGSSNPGSTSSTKIVATSIETVFTTDSVNPSIDNKESVSKSLLTTLVSGIIAPSSIITTISTSDSYEGNFLTNMSETFAETPATTVSTGFAVQSTRRRSENSIVTTLSSSNPGKSSTNVISTSTKVPVENRETMTENLIVTTHAVGNSASSFTNIYDTSTQNLVTTTITTYSDIETSEESNSESSLITTPNPITSFPFGITRILSSVDATITEMPSNNSNSASSAESNSDVTENSVVTNPLSSVIITQNPITPSIVMATISSSLDTTTSETPSNNGKGNSANANTGKNSAESNSDVTENSVRSIPINSIISSTYVTSAINITTIPSVVSETAAIPTKNRNSNSRNSNAVEILTASNSIPSSNSDVTISTGGSNPDNALITTQSSVTPEIMITILSTISTTTVPPTIFNNSENLNNSNNSNSVTHTNTVNAPTKTSSLTTPTSRITILGSPTPTTTIISASFMSLGDQISLVVIGLCILGVSGLVFFGIFSKRVQKIQQQEIADPEFPLYADIFEKENMHG